MSITRRSFLAGSAALAACRDLVDTSPIERAVLPAPGASGIRHIVVVMMENRSFDHFLGWLPGADGMQAGLSYQDAAGVSHSTHPLAPNFQGCGFQNPDHSYAGGRVEYDGGACDGWMRVNDDYSLGYYTQADLAFLGRAAPYWTVCDRYFSPIMAPTYPNRFYQHCGVTDRLDDALALTTLPTIWDRLASAGLRGLYYASDLPFLGLWGTKYLGITRPYLEFLFDCALGTLPEVSFVDPGFIGESNGTSTDDEPPSDIRAGEAFLARTYQAIRSSPAWRSTVLVINFDEWGGFFDHVAPEEAPDVDPSLALRGFRVPCLVISPFARRGYVASGTYDHTSILRMIEWRWGLAPLSVRDATANNLAEVLDFTSPNLAAPSFAVPGFTATACRTSG